jgi:hypothetical protein
LCRGPPNDFEKSSCYIIGATNSPSVAHVGYDISPLPRVKFKILTTRLTACGSNFKFNSLEWRNIVIDGQLKENLYS